MIRIETFENENEYYAVALQDNSGVVYRFTNVDDLMEATSFAKKVLETTKNYSGDVVFNLRCFISASPMQVILYGGTADRKVYFESDIIFTQDNFLSTLNFCCEVLDMAQTEYNS